MAPDKASALRYKAFLDELGNVTCEVIISPPDEREGFDEVDAEESSDAVVAFWQRMMKRFGSEKAYNKRSSTPSSSETSRRSSSSWTSC